ncbi:MAG: EF-P lysine aminoacylase EpmA [Cellvibrionales bacterium]|nr:EF-P lysine aminoacylase EpmA [Cellvibrionales bacterium]
MSWQPSASFNNIRARAAMLAKIRQFFAERNVLEVETPLVCDSTVTDPYIESLQLTSGDYLQTSPEYAMKRLLAAGIGDCYQICKAFREDESGLRHNPEFTLLEWYRVGFSLDALMDEVGTLVNLFLPNKKVEKLTYQEAFERTLGFDPLAISLNDLKAKASQHIQLEMPDGTLDDWLNALISLVIEPTLGKEGLTFIYQYPPSQAALAKLTKNDRTQSVAARFELYYQGIELANGFDELTDQPSQAERFAKDNDERQQRGQKRIPIDQAFLTSLAQLPDCSGVALGLDRLLMLNTQSPSIQDVLTFPDRQ